MAKKDIFIDAAKGAALGTGILPGVSVGTVGFIVDIYDKLIDAIDGLRKHFGKALLTLLPIALGCVVSAILLLLFWQKVGSVYVPFIIIAALAGFVVGGFPMLMKELKGHHWTAGDICRLVLGFLIAAGIGILSYLSAAGIIAGPDFNEAFLDPFHNAWIFPVVLVAGFLAAVACLIPGISGSMILFILGLYQPIVNLLISNSSLGTVSIWHDASRLGPGLLLIFTMLIGILAGFLITSKAMKDLLAKHRVGTFTVVIGFVLGSLVSMFVNNQMYDVYHSSSTNQIWQFIVGGLALLAVAAGTYFLLRRQSKAQGK